MEHTRLIAKVLKMMVMTVSWKFVKYSSNKLCDKEY